jgi:HSP20 family protein
MNCTIDTNAVRKARRVFQPRIDLWETTTAWNVVAELPGVRAEDLDITAKEGTLTLSAKVQDRTFEGASVRRHEYGVGDFERTFHLGEDVNADEADATLKDGVLTLRLPKHESALPKKVQIKQG